MKLKVVFAGVLFFILCNFIFSSVRLYVFYSSGCEKCEIVRQENLKEIGEMAGVEIEARYFNVEIENYQKLVELEEKYKDTDNELPVVFIGKYVLGGEEEIKKRLEEVIREYAKTGSRWPDEIKDKEFQSIESNRPEISKHPVYIAFFYQTTCKECERVFYLLNYLKKKYPFLKIKEFNLMERENKILFEAIGEKIKIPEEKRIIPATLIIGNDYLQQREINLKNIEKIIGKYKEEGAECIWKIGEEKLKEAEERIIKRFKEFGILPVCLAGLIDGINPCAFAVIVFFISYLVAIKRKGKEILIVGFSFMAGVFITYFLFGCGVFSFLSKFTYYSTFSKVLNFCVGAGAIILGFLSFYDFLKARKGKIKNIKLQLPQSIKKRIHSTIISKGRLKNYAIGSFISGVIVSFLEFVCTGQVYFPTIVFVLNQERQGYFYLFLYNLFFIFPLLLILLFSYAGMSSHKISEFSRNNVIGAKILLSLFFFFLGGYLLLNTF